MSDESHAIYRAGITPGIGFISGPEGETARREALDNDEETSYRILINIVGKERQGKTSLRRLLAQEPFNPNEKSTVGIEHELVDTKGVTDSWSPVSITEANLTEYDLVLGKCVRQRLKRQRPANRSYYLAHIVLFTKIAGISYCMIWLFLTLLRMEWIQELPWVAGFWIVLFTASSLTFRAQEGLGIAIGIVALLLHCEALHRWQPSLASQLNSTKETSIFVLSYLEAYLLYGALDSFIALSCGASMGKGIPVVLCLTKPPEVREKDSEHAMLNPHIHLFTLFLFVGLATFKFKSLKYFVLVPTTAILIALLPHEYSYTMFFGLGCGQSHMFFLRIGQNFYLAVNGKLKQYFPARWQRRLLVDLMSIVPGLLAAFVFGWDLTYMSSLAHIISGLICVVSVNFINSLLGAVNVSQSEKTIKKPSDILLTRIQTPRLKLILKDFAGHPLYHCAHHIYMGGHAVYIVVFNLEEAKDDFQRTLSTILYWLQTIYVHAHFPDVSVILVGSHRDSPRLRAEDRHFIGKQLREDIPRQFHEIIVWNQEDVPFFVVENSIRDENDSDHKALREAVLKVARNASFMKQKWPIRYLSFFKVIESFRKQGKLSENISVLFNYLKSTDCGVNNIVELEEMLLYFNTIGEVMYNARDNRLKDLVIFDGRLMVGIMGSLVTVPPKHQRKREVFSDWTQLEVSGLCSMKLLDHVLRADPVCLNQSVGCERVAEILESYDLLCKVHLPSQVRKATDSGDCYLVPVLLPDQPQMAENDWITEDTDNIFYVDFGQVDISSIFLRLVCQCTGNHDVSVTKDGINLLNIGQKYAQFNSGTTYSYKLELSGVGDKYQNKQVIKVTIRSWTTDGGLPLIKELQSRLTRIIRSNFDKCSYILGVPCPLPGPHDGSHGEAPHILPLVDSLLSRHEVFPVQKSFVCLGRKVVIRGGTSRAVSVKPVHVPVMDFTHRHILDLPESLYSHICSELNTLQILAKDWRGLAGALGYTHRQVEQLSIQTNPCSALLHQWADDQNVTVEDLISKLRKIQRDDIIAYLEDPDSCD